MTIYSLLYQARCDVCGLQGPTNANQFRLRDDLDRAGWRFRRRKDGEYARRGGRDYCPKCASPKWKADR